MPRLLSIDHKRNRVITSIECGKDKTLTASYRPISLLPILSKIFEGILADRLKLYTEAYNIIPKHQFGFRKNHSTIQQIHRVVNKLYTDFDNKKF